jgi:hypothetical protein
MEIAHYSNVIGKNREAIQQQGALRSVLDCLDLMWEAEEFRCHRCETKKVEVHGFDGKVACRSPAAKT